MPSMVEMCLGDVLPLQKLFMGETPCYDKDPSLPAYTLGALDWPTYRSCESDRKVQTITHGVRVHVPMHGSGDDSSRTYRLLREASKFEPDRHLSAWDLAAIEGYFRGLGSTLFQVAKHPETEVDVPADVRFSLLPKIPRGTLYCTPLGSEFGLRVECAALGRGYLLWNPLAVLRVKLP